MKALSKTNDGYLLLEQSTLNAHRSDWQEGSSRVRSMYRSKRYVPHVDVLGLVLDWMTSHGSADSVVERNDEDLLCFAEFPESF